MLPPSILHGTVTVDASGVIDDEDMMEEGQIHCIAVQCFFARLPRLRDAPFSKKMETTEPKVPPQTGNKTTLHDFKQIQESTYMASITHTCTVDRTRAVSDERASVMKNVADSSTHPSPAASC